MKRLPVVVLGLLMVAPLGCRKDVKAPPPALKEGEVNMMPGVMPRGTPQHIKKAVEGKVQQQSQPQK
jgi:hypothetical protein